MAVKKPPAKKIIKSRNGIARTRTAGASKALEAQNEELRAAQEHLRQERDLLQVVMDSTKNMHLVHLDRDFNFVRVNAAYAETCGYRPEEMVGKNHFALYPHAENEAIFRRVRDTGEAFEVSDKPFEFPDQPERGVTYWDWTLTPLKNAAGAVTGLVFALRETTQRKRAEEALQKINAFNQSIIDSSSDCIKILDMEGRLQYMSPSGKLLLEIRDFSPYVNVPYTEFWKGSDREHVIEAIEQAKRGKNGSFQGYCPTAGGTPKWWDVSISPVLGPDGRPERLLAVSRDITEHKKAEEALKESERRFRTLVSILSDVAWTADPMGELQGPQPAFEKFTGTTAEQNRGFGWAKTLHPDDRQRVAELWQRAYEMRQEYESRGRIWHAASQSYHYYIARAAPVLNADGSIREWVGAITDINEQKLAEAALKASEQRYHSLFNNMTEGFAYCKMLFDEHGEPADFIYLEVNHSFERLTGLTNVVGKKVSEVIPGIRETDPELFQLYGRVALVCKPERTEFYVEALKMWFSLSVYCPEKEYFVAVFDVITERKKAEEDIRRAAEFRAAAMDRLGEGLYTVDDKGLVSYMNPAAEELFGWSFAELRGKRMHDMTHHHYRDGRPFPIEECVGFQVKTTGRPLKNFEDVFIRKNGEFFDVSYSIAPMRDAAGDINGLVVAFSDITERKKAEEALKSAHTELEHRAFELNAVNRELEAFAYTVSHDLKTPLRSIEGFTKAIIEDYSDKLDAIGRDYLGRVGSAAFRMNQLIEAMLNMARRTSGELHERTVDLGSLVQVAVHDLRKRDPGRRVEVVIAEKIYAKGDSDMLLIVLQNLLDNAWKFTSKNPAAKIEFGATVMEGKTVYFVRDNGAGFDMRFADKLFLPFKRLHTEAEFAGLGIGLAIAYRIILRHGGRMWAQSEPGKGATFFFTL